MKTKTICALLLGAQLPIMAQTIPLISSEWFVIDGIYQYNYTIDRTQLRHDVSHFLINICNDVQIFEPSSNVIFRIEHNENIFKFDEIPSGIGSKQQPSIFYFSFTSPNIPTTGTVVLKAGKNKFVETEFVPGCETIPEPDASLFGLIGTILLLKRRRR
jgi:hypothetical protein